MWHLEPFGDWFIGIWGWIGLIFTALFWILVLVALVLLIRALVRRPQQTSDRTRIEAPKTGGGPQPGADARATALRILEERYARGEIDRDEFLQKKSDLTS